MAIAPAVSNFLTAKRISYRVIPHRYAESSVESAETADLPVDHVAKGVLLVDEGAGSYVLAVIPASRRLSLEAVSSLLDRSLRLADETELARVFPDCRLGAVPAFGPAYGLETVVDLRLDNESPVFIEAGDHEDLIELDDRQFDQLFSGCRHGDISDGEEPEEFRH